jgi:alanine racemase
MMRDARILLDTQALRHNLARVRDYAPHSQILSMVKADAYGHGLAFALDALADTDAFGVAFLHEARQVRVHSALPIVLMEGVFSLEEWQEAAALGASCVIHQACQIDWALSHVVAGATVWLKLNAGMNRLGLAPDALLAAAQQLRAAGYQLILTMHFANADEPDHPLNAQQLAVFHHIKQKLEPIQASTCNSAALMQWPQYHFDWVRPGIMLYGSSPFADRSAASLDLTPVMTLQSHIIALHHLNVGDAVGYGSRWVAQRPTHLAIVAIGYGDGYPRVVDQSCVSIHDQLMPIVGRVSMDMLMVDVTDLSSAAHLHQAVILWGQSPHVDQIAHAAQTIGYELLCRLTQRPTRAITPERSFSALLCSKVSA